MKLYSILFLSLVLIGLSSCTEEECCVNPPEGEITMIGEWRLDMLCFSNGATSCGEDDLWEPDYSECVTFTEDTFSFNRDGEICSGTYVTTTSGFGMTAENGCFFEVIEYIIIDHNAERLVMSPLCTDGCRYVYLRK